MILSFALALLAASPGASAAQQGEAQIREAIETVLGMRHPTDTPDWWRKLGPEAPSIIMSMYESSTHPYQRLRLVQALAWFDDPAAIAFLKKQAKADPQDDVVRNAAVRSIGTSQGSREREFVAEFLAHPDSETRFAAAASLKRMSELEHDAEAAKALEKYLATEKVPWIKGRLSGELPQPTARLLKVTSSESHPARLLDGVWRGFLVASPRDRKKQGMESEAATLKAGAGKEDGQLSAEITFLAGEKGRVFHLEEVTRKGRALKGVLRAAGGGESSPGPAPSGAPGAASLAFTGEVAEVGGDRQLELKVPAMGATVILRRDP